MKKSDYILWSLINAAGVLIYIFMVAWTMSNAESILGERQGLFVPVFVLLLFIISATITGFLVLGKPMRLYLDGLKREAFVFLSITLSWLILFLVTVAIVLLLL